ncbi:MAG: tetratricopeptide repeat protein [Lewinella sp.]|nr:tetratricopeptide repeat protein [Lewinella sp.]
MSTDPENEYFSDGITEEIINALTRDQGLKVIARTSSFAFKGKNIDVREIGRQLGVTNILEGSVCKVGQRVRVTAQLINATDGAHLWSKNFDRQLDDIFALQDELSLLIADRIREEFGHFEIEDAPHAAPTRNIGAYELLLKGSYFFKRKDYDDIRKAMGYFEAAIEADPHYAAAHAFQAETYLHFGGFGILPNGEAHDRARLAAKKAISLDPAEARAHKVMAYIHLFYDWDWDAALRAYQTAIRHGLANENEFITYYYIFIEKDYERAIRVARQVLETDPLHLITHWQLGMCYYFAGRFEEAIAAYDHALELDAGFGEALRWRGVSLGFLGRYEEALVDIQRALDLVGGRGPATFDRLQVLALMGEREAVIEGISQQSFTDPTEPATLYTLLKMPKEAMHWLEKGYQERCVMLVSLKHYWLWDPIRDDVRFQALYARMNFTHPAPAEASEPAISGDSGALLTPAEIKRFLQELDRHMSQDRPYLDPALSLRQLAEELDLHPNKLSWLLNEQVGQNFNEYVNGYRLATFKLIALEPANQHLTLLGLAYESGFNSKSVFNDFFKKREGLTPGAWVKAHKV